MAEDRRERPVDQAERRIELEIDMALDMPDERAMPVVQEDVAGRNALDALPDAPGRVVHGRVARERIGGMNLPAEAAAAAAAVGHAMRDAVDEITDEQAAAYVGRALDAPMGAADRNHLLGAPDDRMLELGAPAWNPNALVAPNGGAFADVGAEPVPPPIPDNLPDVLRTTVLDPNRRTEAPPVDPEWLTVYQLPRYMQQGIRALGRAIFDIFPCFETQRRSAAAAQEDALGSIQVLANLQGGGPSRQGDLDVVASWIRRNGVPIEASRLELPMAIPGYQPRLILCVSENRSYLMVDERRADGAPIDGQYIYSWDGGQVHYLANPEHMQRLGRVVEGAGPVHRLGGPGNGLMQRQAIGRGNRPVLAAPPIVEPEGRPAADPVARRKRLASIAQAPSAPGGLIMELRRTGFLPHGPQAVPTFRRDLDDGGSAEIRGQQGVPASRSESFEMVVADESGNEAWSGTIASADDVEAALASLASAPRI